VTTATGSSSPPLPPEPPVVGAAGPPAAAPAVDPPPPQPPPGPGVAALRVVGVLVALLVVAGTTVNVVSRFFHQERIETAVYTQPISALSVTTTTGDVSISVGATGSPVVVRRVLQWSFGTASSVESVTDGRLDVTARCSIGFGLGSCDVGYEITVPPGLALQLSSHTGDVDTAGPIGDLTVSNHTGDVEVRGAAAARADVSTSTGNVNLSFVTAPRDVLVRASTGDVGIVVPSDGTSYDVRTAASTGDESVTVPNSPGADRRIDVGTSTGDIDVRSAG
jgi:hypothetical protein